MEELLTGLTRHHLLIFTLVALSNLAIGFWWLRWPPALERARDWLTARSWRTAAFIALAASALWVGIFVIYAFPITGDVRAFFLPQARAALSGEIPNADFTSLYMPLFPYLLGVVDLIGPGILAIPLFFTICFVAGGILLPKLSVKAGLSAPSARALALVGLFNGASWLLAIGYQQDEALMFLLSVIAMILLVTGWDLSAGLLIGLGVMGTKILFLLTAAALAMHAARRWRFLAGAVLGCVPLGLLFLSLGFNPFRMIRGGVHELVPPSLWTLVSAWPTAFEALNRNPWINIIPVGATCLALVLIFRARRPDHCAEGMMRAVVAVWLGYLLLSLFSPPTYRILILPFLPALLERSGLPRRTMVLAFCVYCTALGVQWMLYEDLFEGPYARFLMEHGGEPGSTARMAIQLLIDSIILGSEICWLVLLSRRQTRTLTVNPH